MSAIQTPGELPDLLRKLVDEQLDRTEMQCLAEILRTDSNAQQFYDHFIMVHSLLTWRYAPPLASASPDREEDQRKRCEMFVGESVEGTQQTATIPSRSFTAQQPPSPFPTFRGNTLHGTVGYFSSGWPVAYLVATVIVGVGLLIGAFVHVSTPGQVVRQSAPSPSTLVPSSSSRMQFVGRITGMVDCQWADPQAEAISGTYVPLGRRYALYSGLIEITYDTGAKVILQGPVTYQVESAAGGFLALGKLTARVEKKADYPQSTTHDSLFAVRTPTSIVTDLGTEFAVEADETGQTTSHVFRGAVRLQVSGAGEEDERHSIVVRANESARVERENDRTSLHVRRLAGIAAVGFVRQMPLVEQQSPSKVLAYFRLGEDDFGAVAQNPARDCTFSHHHQFLDRHGAPRYVGGTAAPRSTLAVSFTAGAEGEWYSTRNLSNFTPTDNFIFEAWVRVMNKSPAVEQTILYNGHSGSNGYGIMVKDGTWQILFGGVACWDSGVRWEPGKWEHVALVREQRKTRLWVNGRTIGEAFEGEPATPEGWFMIGCQSQLPRESFEIQIDEVRLSTFSGHFQPAMLLLPTNTKAIVPESR
jgi:hypothetical protein